MVVVKMEDDERKKVPDITDLFNVRILGIDFGELLKNCLGSTDLKALQDPAQVEQVKKRIEEQREKLKEDQEQFRKKYGNAVRFDYDIRIKSLLGSKDEVRIGGGDFFERLDQLDKERAQWRSRPGSLRKAAPYRRPEGVREPSVEVIEDKEHLEVIAEMPGVEEKDIEVKVEQDKLTISTEKSERKYHAQVNLPSKVVQEPSEKTYVNGMLKIKIAKSQLPQK